MQINKDMNLLTELYDIEKDFESNGYTEQMIEEIKHQDGEVTTEGFIANLQEERSYWDC